MKQEFETNSHVERIERTSVPESAVGLIDEYERAVGERDRFLWKWLSYLFPEVTLSCVESSDRVREAKLLTSLYVIMLDDVAEQARDEPTFREAAKVPFDHQTPDPDRQDVDSEFVALATTVWERVEDALGEGPRAEQFRDVLEFDVKQNLNAIDYSYLTNRHLELATVEETTIYDAHNMMLFTYADVDLIFSPEFETDELGVLRRIVRRAQGMARIGNWVSTWKRELAEGDFSSGVVVYALENGIVSRTELPRLRAGDAEDIRRDVVSRIEASNVEELFFDRWQGYHEEIRGLESAVESVDVGAFLDGMETLLECHLASMGLK